MSSNLPIVKLRALEPEDLEILYTIENNPSEWNVGATNVPYSRYVLRDYIANTTSDIYADRQLRLMVTNDSGDTVGIADLVNFEPRHLRAEIGIVILDRYRRHGYGEAALQKLITYARSILHLHQLYAIVPVSNTSCIQLFDKLEFKDSHCLRKWLFGDHGFEDAVMFCRML
ncbi:MAG: GNAT family N-acetyltransferase [Prevotella sp.]